MTFVALGDAALRGPLPAGVDARAAFEALRVLPGVHDVVATETHVAVYFDPELPGAARAARLEAALASAGRSGARAAELHVVRVRYDGVDVDEIASGLGLARDEVVRLHAGREYTARLIGFLPGFAYLGDVDPRLVVARRPTPRPRVTPGAVAIAAQYTAIYPFASPGGWSLLGHAVDFAPFDRARGAVIALGDRVRFEAA